MEGNGVRLILFRKSGTEMGSYDLENASGYVATIWDY